MFKNYSADRFWVVEGLEIPLLEVLLPFFLILQKNGQINYNGEELRVKEWYYMY